MESGLPGSISTTWGANAIECELDVIFSSRHCSIVLYIYTASVTCYEKRDSTLTHGPAGLPRAVRSIIRRAVKMWVVR